MKVDSYGSKNVVGGFYRVEFYYESVVPFCVKLFQSGVVKQS